MVDTELIDAVTLLLSHSCSSVAPNARLDPIWTNVLHHFETTSFQNIFPSLTLIVLQLSYLLACITVSHFPLLWPHLSLSYSLTIEVWQWLDPLDTVVMDCLHLSTLHMRKREIRENERHTIGLELVIVFLVTAASSYINKSPLFPSLHNHLLFCLPDFLIDILLFTHLSHSSSHKPQRGEIKPHLVLLRL